MNKRAETGLAGEEIAADFLIKKDYRILERNHRQKWGEIDIIARDPFGILVFVEVKTMRQNNSAIAELKPEDNLTASKIKKLQKAAQLFTGKHLELLQDDKGWRIDLIAICLTLNNIKIQHYENI